MGDYSLVAVFHHARPFEIQPAQHCDQLLDLAGSGPAVFGANDRQSDLYSTSWLTAGFDPFLPVRVKPDSAANKYHCGQSSTARIEIHVQNVTGMRGTRGASGLGDGRRKAPVF